MNKLTTTPALLKEIDAHHRLSTRWLADALDKKIWHMTEVVLKIDDARDFEHQRDSRGYVVNTWLPLTDALILMSQFQGEKAVKARNLIREALDWYMNQKPQLEAELAALRSQSHARKHLTGPRKGMMPVPIEQATLFGDMPVVRYVMMPLNSVSDVAKTKAQLRHIQRQMEGMARTVNKLQNRLDGR